MIQFQILLANVEEGSDGIPTFVWWLLIILAILALIIWIVRRG